MAAPLAGQVDAATLPVHDQAAPDTARILAHAGLTVSELRDLRTTGAIA